MGRNQLSGNVCNTFFPLFFFCTSSLCDVQLLYSPLNMCPTSPLSMVLTEERLRCAVNPEINGVFLDNQSGVHGSGIGDMSLVDAPTCCGA